MTCAGVRCHACGEHRSILDGHVARGFAHCSESALSRILGLKGAVVPEATASGVDWQTELKLACFAELAPDLLDTQVANRLQEAYVAENPSVYDELAVPSNLLAEVVTAPEAKAAAEFSRSLEQARARRALVSATVDKRLPSYGFPPAPSRPWRQKETKRPPWLAARTPESTETVSAWIRSHLPAGTAIHVDPHAGRWQVLGPAQAHKSVAWTARGHRRAAVEALRWAWVFWADFHKKPAPYDYQEWLSELDAGAGDD